MNLLAGDIGGTKTLLGIYTSEKTPRKLFQRLYLSNEWASLEPKINEFINETKSEVSKVTWPKKRNIDDIISYFVYGYLLDSGNLF